LDNLSCRYLFEDHRETNIIDHRRIEVDGVTGGVELQKPEILLITRLVDEIGGPEIHTGASNGCCQRLTASSSHGVHRIAPLKERLDLEIAIVFDREFRSQYGLH
jgi:hypothetical protein